MQQRPGFVVLAIIALTSLEAVADPCDVRDTPRSCVKKLQQHVAKAEPRKEDLDRELVSRDVDVLGKINTGQSSATTVLPTSAFNDFFSLLNAAAQTGQGGEESKDQAFGFEFNTCGVTLHRSVQCQLKGRIGDAHVYEPLIAALPEDSRATRKEEFEASLDVSDNVTAGFFLNVVTRRLGRVPDFSDEGVFAAMRARAFDETTEARTSSSQAAGEWLDFLEEILARKQEECAAAPAPEKKQECEGLIGRLEGVDLTFRDYPDGANGTLALSIYERTTLARLQAVGTAQARLRSYGYFDLIQLVNNQPQLNFGVQITGHGDLAGPDEVRAKLSYEMGAQNMNALTDRCDGERALAMCAQQFLADPGVKAGLLNGDRVAFTLEYVRQKRYVISLPDDGVALDLPSQRSWVGSIVWGRYLTATSADGRASRFDLVGSYEDVSSDPLRQDRGVATLTFSQRLMNGLIATVAIIYATKPEFRGEVAEEWGSHLGLNYKFGREMKYAAHTE
jgi:hypothetical protein